MIKPLQLEGKTNSEHNDKNKLFFCIYLNFFVILMSVLSRSSCHLSEEKIVGKTNKEVILFQSKFSKLIFAKVSPSLLAVT